jgi:hypothetical protein
MNWEQQVAVWEAPGLRVVFDDRGVSYELRNSDGRRGLAPKLHQAGRLRRSEGGVELVGAPHAALA